jgi:hypothetical protein
MTSFRRYLRRIFFTVSGLSVSGRGASVTVLGGLGLALLLGGAGTSLAQVERGEAEQAPPGVVGDPAPAEVAPEAPISPAVVVAHTAQLPKTSPSTKGKPLADLSRPAVAQGQGLTTTSQGATAAPSSASTIKVASPKPGATGPAKRTRLPLAPSAGEIRREIAARNGGPPTVTSANPNAAAANKPATSTGARLQEQATTPPQQNSRWPTHVDYTAGPSGPAGGNTAAERKGAMIETAGPQQGVIRNQW